MKTLTQATTFAGSWLRTTSGICGRATELDALAQQSRKRVAGFVAFDGTLSRCFRTSAATFDHFNNAPVIPIYFAHATRNYRRQCGDISQ